jgi:hypothetical protein
MGRINAVLLAMLIAYAPSAVAQDIGDRQALVRQIEQRFDVLPVQGGVVLRPKTPIRDVRSIQLADGEIAIDGEVVTGAEVRQRLNDAADSVIRLSYLPAAEQRALFEPRRPSAPGADTPAAEPEAPAAPDVPREPATPRRPRNSGRGSDRVRIGGSVRVGPDEVVSGDAAAIGGNSTVDGQVFGDVVAIAGGATVNGSVGGDVVSVGGSTTLGPRADVNGDVVVIGGTLHKDPAARIGGQVKEIGLGEINLWPGGWSLRPSDASGGLFGNSGVGSLFALVSTLSRLAVLCILASIVILFSREFVERVGVQAAREPLKAGAIGLLIQLLFFPVLLATIFLMVITLIGIPLLLLIPFALVAAVLLALVGFTAVAYDLGQLAAQRFGSTGQSPYLIAGIGIALLLSPLVLSRLLGFAGGFLWPITGTLVFLGLCAEYLAWTVGLGAIALVRFGRKSALVQP